MRFHEAYHFIKGLPRVGGLARHNGNTYGQGLMSILRANLRDGHVEALPRLVDQTPANLPFIL
jgi:hypothetical protein